MGWKPSQRRPGELRRSYTQIEYDVARELKKPLYLFLANENYEPDNLSTQSDEEKELQLTHRHAIEQSGDIYYRFADREELGSRIRELHFPARSAEAARRVVNHAPTNSCCLTDGRNWKESEQDHGKREDLLHETFVTFSINIHESGWGMPSQCGVFREGCRIIGTEFHFHRFVGFCWLWAPRQYGCRDGSCAGKSPGDAGQEKWDKTRMQPFPNGQPEHKKWEWNEDKGSNFTLFTPQTYRAYDNLIKAMASDYQNVSHRRVAAEDIRAFFAPGEVKLRTFANYQILDLDGFLGRLISSSYVPSIDQPGHQEIVEAAKKIFEAHQVGGKITFEYRRKSIWDGLIGRSKVA
jgi:hypothetical protein